MFIRSLLLSTSLLFLGVAHATNISENISVHTGMQKYKADRVFEFVSRIERSAAKVVRDSVDTTTVSFGSNHLELVDERLTELSLRHPRELSGVSVTYLTDTEVLLEHLTSVNALRVMGAKVRFKNGTLPCIENVFTLEGFDCKIFVIQFHATRRGEFDE